MMMNSSSDGGGLLVILQTTVVCWVKDSSVTKYIALIATVVVA